MSMQVVILAGGRGTRISEETISRPKPMVEIGGKPILWHIMAFYASYGYKEFLVACGYKGDLIKEYFRNIVLRDSDFILDLRDGAITVLNGCPLDWRVGIIDTGLDTMTGGRLRRLQPLIGSEAFMCTYGDGLSDVDLPALLEFHRSHGRLATVTAVRPPARFGALEFDGDAIRHFKEKSTLHEGWINGGFSVVEPEALTYITSDVMWEHAPMEALAGAGQLVAYRHEAFWQCMDTLRDLRYLESLWDAGRAPWKTW